MKKPANKSIRTTSRKHVLDNGRLAMVCGGRDALPGPSEASADSIMIAKPQP